MKKIIILAILLFIPLASAVKISEVMAAPTQNNQYNEWIEIYNDGSEDVDLANYTICGKPILAGYMKYTGATKGELTNEAGTVLKASTYAIITDGGSGTEVYTNFQVDPTALALHLSTATLCGGLSNEGDTVTLNDASFAYSKAKVGKSFSLIDTKIVETDPTPGSKNTAEEPEVEEAPDLPATLPADENETEVVVNNTEEEVVEEAVEETPVAKTSSKKPVETTEDAEEVTGKAVYTSPQKKSLTIPLLLLLAAIMIVIVALQIQIMRKKKDGEQGNQGEG